MQEQTVLMRPHASCYASGASLNASADPRHVTFRHQVGARTNRVTRHQPCKGLPDILELRELDNAPHDYNDTWRMACKYVSHITS